MRRTLERVAVKTLRVLNADVARAPQADLREISHKIRASGVNREIMVYINYTGSGRQSRRTLDARWRWPLREALRMTRLSRPGLVKP